MILMVNDWHSHLSTVLRNNSRCVASRFLQSPYEMTSYKLRNSRLAKLILSLLLVHISDIKISSHLQLSVVTCFARLPCRHVFLLEVCRPLLCGCMLLCICGKKNICVHSMHGCVNV